MTVRILVQNAQTKMMKVGTVTGISETTGKHWIKNKWAKKVKDVIRSNK